MSSQTKFSENKLLLIICLVQFINILDFMMVMPLGPDFADRLGIPVQHLGYIGGSYTLAAAVSGLFGALFLDWFDRRRMILITLLGLSVATMLPCFATDLTTMVGARMLAGIFGGPLTASAYAMVADLVPPERRGVAMGKVMGAFSLSSVLGVPFGLELAQHIGWQAPFVTLGIIAFIVWLMALRYLPVSVNELAVRKIKLQIAKLIVTLKSGVAWSSWGYSAFAVIGAFLIVPNVSAHVQYNMNFPRDELSMLYLAGGGISYFAMRYAGLLVDKTNATLVSIGSTFIFVVTIYMGCMQYQHFSAYALYIGFMVANTARNVAGQALSSKVPLPSERASYLSIQSTITHLSLSCGAFLGSMIVDGEGQTLHHVEYLGYGAIATALMVPVLFWNTERLLNKRVRAVKADPLIASDLPPA